MREEVSFRTCNGTKRVRMFCRDASLTDQAQKDECDLAKIVSRFAATPQGRKAIQTAEGYLNDVSGRFLDVSGVTTYQDAFKQMDQAKAVFEALPSALRKRFDHDPASFVDFALNPDNLNELRSLGLAKPKVEDSVKKETPVGGSVNPPISG